MKTYPICLINLVNKRVVVIGGGQVALRKVRGLLDADAGIHLISPKVVDDLETLARAGLITWEQRNYRAGDLSKAFLVIAATDAPDVNETIWQEAQQEGCLINTVDDPAHCNFILPALVRRGEFSIAVSSGGASPALARHIREKLEDEFGPEYEDFTKVLGELRQDLLANTTPGKERLNLANQLIDSKLMEILKQEGYAQAKKYGSEIIKSDSNYD
jgi:precorrin-2 dehydrogenase/sirohydrochlorin ferrochelatase